MKKRNFLFLFLLFLALACNENVAEKKNTVTDSLIAMNYRQIDSVKTFINSGDIIFRNGTDEVSRAARSMNRSDTSFSHCGFVYKENDSFFVYHALGGIYNPGQKLKRELLDSFCNPAENDAVGIYRYALKEEEEKKLNTVVRSYFKAGLKFDLFFNFQSDDVMYCSEFVFKSLNQSKNGALTKYVRLDTIPYGVTTDDIFLNENCRLIKRQQFRR
jgi:hypothetical protein